MKLITIIAVLTMFSGCITVNKIYPTTKHDTVYLEKPILGYWPHDRGIDPGFWTLPFLPLPSFPSMPSGPFYPFYKPWPVIDTFKIKSGNGWMAWPGCDTASYIRITGGNTDTLKLIK